LPITTEDAENPKHDSRSVIRRTSSNNEQFVIKQAFFGKSPNRTLSNGEASYPDLRIEN
jgi:hypothetical protein